MQKHVPVTQDESSDVTAEHAGEGASGFDINAFIRVLIVRRAVIIGTAALVIVLTAIVVFMLKPMYTATALVMLDQRKNNVEDVSAVLSGLPSDAASVQDQVQILKSLELSNRVVNKLHLEQDPEFNPSGSAGVMSFLSYLNPFNWFPGNGNSDAASRGADAVHDKVVHNFLSRIDASPIGQSTAISISFESENAAKSASLANAVADAYVEDGLEAKFQATQKATQWLTERIAELSRQAQDADAAVQKYKAEHNITTTANGVSVVQQQTSDINAQLVLAKADLAEKEANYNSIAALARTGHAADSSLAVASPLISTLRSQETEIARQLADLSSKYLPGHPKILDLQAQKANIDAKIAEEVQRVVDSVRNEVSIASAHVSSLEASLKQLETQGAGQNQDQVQLTALQSNATSTRSMYEAFLGRLSQAQGQQGIQTPDARVISAAEMPSVPSSPKKGLALEVAAPAGIILGLIIAFMLERMDAGFRTGAQVESLLGVPVLATVPEIRNLAQGSGAADHVIDKPLSAFAEAIRGLQLGLSLSNVDTPPKVVIVTSSVPSEGKTTLAVSLARMAARSGLKTVVVDCDLRRPSVTKAFGDVKPERGLIEALTGVDTIENCFVKDIKTGMLILPVVKTPASPADILNSQAFQHLITGLRSTFDLVVVDSAPMLPVNDTKLIARLADAVLFVVRWETTPREASVNALRALADVRAAVSGIALTRADTERYRYYSYGYQNYYYYNKYYND